MTDQPTALKDLAPFAVFVRECEKEGVATKGQLNWWLRYRKTNGLLSSGAIIEKKISPTARRPMLYAHRPRFAEWLSTSDTQAA
jgi:hypothetical protein